MMQWIERLTRTRTQVNSRVSQQQERSAARLRAMRAVAAVQLAVQLLLWVTFGGYDRAVQAVWQAALALIVPLFALWFLHRSAAPGLDTRAGRWVALLLLPCLWLDAVLMLYALCGLIDGLIPEYPYAVGAAAAAAACWLALLISRPTGVAYGTSALRWPLVLFFLLGTVFLRASNRADRLWPLLGQGAANTAMTALRGAGGTWGTALLFVLPGPASPKERPKAMLWAVVPWLMGAVWALWYGFLRPWSPGDALDVSERLMGLARHADSVLSYELAGLMWLTALPAALTGGALAGEQLLIRALPRLPRLLSTAAILLPAALVVVLLPSRLPQWLTLLLPWRGALSLLTGILLLLCAGREGRL